MTKRVILAIDQGTSNSKAVLISQTGEIIARGSHPVPIHHPKSGWVQQDPEEIWNSVLAAIRACLSDVSNTEIAAIGISNQRESVTLWQRSSGQPLGPCLTWQCRRTSEQCQELKRLGHESMILNRTGLPIDPLFPALKVKWLLEHMAENQSRIPLDDICVGTVDSWLIWKLTGGRHACDRSNAARTQLFNIRDCVWDEELCSLFEIPKQILPEVCESQHIFGSTSGLGILPDGIPIGSAIGDSHGALFGHCAFNPGDGKITFGTGSSVMMTIPEFLPPDLGITATIAWSIDNKPTYAFEGNILVSASVLPWAAELLGLGGGVDELLALSEKVETTDGVYFIPALVGLGSPYWDPTARGLLAGMSFTTGPAHIARAVVESIALQVYDVFHTMEKQSTGRIGKLFVDGGPSRNTKLMNRVASLIRHPVIQSDAHEISALGAAYLAGLSVGFWKDIGELSRLKKAANQIETRIPETDRTTLINGWHDAIQRARLPKIEILK